MASSPDDGPIGSKPTDETARAKPQAGVPDGRKDAGGSDEPLRPSGDSLKHQGDKLEDAVDRAAGVRNER